MQREFCLHSQSIHNFTQKYTSRAFIFAVELIIDFSRIFFFGKYNVREMSIMSETAKKNNSGGLLCGNVAVIFAALVFRIKKKN